MKFTRLIISLFALLLLLPIHVSAQDIHVYPGPDEDWNYLYDYGDVEVGASGVMIFQIECALDSLVGLMVDEVYIEDVDPFTITDEPSYPQSLGRGESIYVEVTFTPPAEGLFEGVMRIATNATIPPGTDIHYALQGMGIAYEPPPDELMQAVMDYYDAGLTDGSIYGLGSGNAHKSRVRVFGNMLDAADDLIAAGDYEGACKQLWDAVLKSDGEKPPPDFIGGPGVSALNSMLLDVLEALGC